jgi:stage IV sporulation protein FB
MAFLFGLAGLFGNPMLLFIALFVYLGAEQEASYAQMKQIARGLQVQDAIVTGVHALAPEATLHEAIEAVLRTRHQHELPVVDSRGTVAGILTRDDIIAGYQRQGAETPVSEVMHRDIPTIFAHAPLERALQLMQESSYPALAAVDRHGRVVGLVTPESIGELMMIHSVLPKGASPSWQKS